MTANLGAIVSGDEIAVAIRVEPAGDEWVAAIYVGGTLRMKTKPSTRAEAERQAKIAADEARRLAALAFRH